MDDDDLYRAPDQVSWAIAAGTAPLPFLGFYATIFLAHGLVYPVSPPDITDSRTGEAIAGFIALALFVVCCLSLVWFSNRRRRWPFLLGQLAVFVTSIDFLVDDTKGGRGVALLLLVTSAIALGLGLHAASWRHMGRAVPWRGRAPRTATATAATPDLGGTAAVVPDGSLFGDPVDPATLPSDSDAASGGRYVGRRRAGRS